MLNLVDSPFNPSGVTHMYRLHRALGFEKELAQITELFDLISKTRNNILAVVVAPYGYGKSEFLDEVQLAAKSRGLKTVRIALSHSFKDELLKSLEGKQGGVPLVVLIDEADELSRLAAMHRLGALSNEEFRQAVMDLASIVRALLEPKNYAHILGEPERYDKILIVAALTPQVYYTILKNVVPDVFDIATGRVYREIMLDTRFPFWLFLEIVASRLDSYVQSKRKDKFWPFTLTELAALYNIALKKGEVSPRYLLKLAARLLELKNKGGGIGDLAAEEGIEVRDKELAEYTLSGIPIKEIDRKYINIFKKIYLYKIPFNDKESINIINKYIRLKGKEINPLDEKTASYEPNLYYSVVEDGKLIIYFASNDEIDELKEYLDGEAYIISEDISAREVEKEDIVKLSKELLDKLQEPNSFISEIEKILELNGIKIKLCCGKALWYNNLGFRELVLLAYIERENELHNIKNFINKVIIEGSIENYPIDYIIGYIFSNTLLTEEIDGELSPVLRISWKNSYIDLANKYVYINIYGADKLDKLKSKIIKFNIDKILGRDPEPLELVESLKLYRERARENALKYTLALKRGKEKKDVALLKVAEQLALGEMPEGMAAFPQIVDILLRKIEGEIHERELKSLIARLFPVNLWRELREDDLIALMVYTSHLVPKDDKIYVKFNIEDARKYLDSLYRNLQKYIEISASFKSRIFGEIKLVKKLDVEDLPREFKDAREYATLVIRYRKALLDLQQRAEEAKGELERELEAKRKLASQLENIAERLPQRIKFMSIDEKTLERESAILKKVEEINEVWSSLRPLALELGKNISVEADLDMLLNLPEPWLEDYLTTLKLYSVKLREEYETYRKAAELRRNMAEWVKAKLGIVDDAEIALRRKAAELKVPYQLLYAIASRGPGRELDPSSLASETSLDERTITKYLDVLAENGLIAKRYVS